MEAIHERIAGIDVHRMKHVVTVLIERDGAVSSQTRQFGGFKRDMRALVLWLREHQIQHIVMESTGIYWKSVFSHLEAAGMSALVVNAFHVKNVPGRKTDVGGTNTRRVRRALASVFGGAVGKDTVSRAWRKVKSDWDCWNARSLAEEPIVRLILVGTVVRVRLDKRPQEPRPCALQ